MRQEYKKPLITKDQKTQDAFDDLMTAAAKAAEKCTPPASHFCVVFYEPTTGITQGIGNFTHESEVKLFGEILKSYGGQLINAINEKPNGKPH